MSSYTKFSTKATPQKEQIPGRTDQIKNSAGGYVFKLGDFDRLERFLILGSEGGTYYVSATNLTKDNAECVLRCINEDGAKTVQMIVDVSKGGRAPSNDPALFALALAASHGDQATRQAALDALPQVARIGTHLFHFAQYASQFRGWGRGMRKAVANWYNEKNVDQLAYQAIKYQSRDGWSHRDLLRLSHPKAMTEDRNEVYRWITKGDADPTQELLAAFEQAKRTETSKQIVKLIQDHNLPREAIPTQFLNDVDVWAALFENMPMTAMVRNLGKMTKIGLIEPMSNVAVEVADRLTNKERLIKARVHPLAILVALKTYEQGHGMRGSLSWQPVREVVDALDDAFYLAFDAVTPTNKCLMLALDVSGSMTHSLSNLPLSCRDASAALALVTANVEKRYITTMFSDAGTNFMGDSNRRTSYGVQGMSTLSLSPKQRLDDVIRKVSGLPFGGTDCALPMLYATKNKLKIDAFVIYTDNETWSGGVHPVQRLQEYRQKSGIDAKLITVGMTATGFSIADPEDVGMLDVVGFNTGTPNLISQIITE